MEAKFVNTELESNVRALNASAVGEVFTRNRLDFNCWGFTAFMEGWVPTLKWINSDEMQKLLDTNSAVVSTSKLVSGDIAVYINDEGTLEHTAIVTDPFGQEIIHKAGNSSLEIQSFDNTLGHYNYGTISEFRRSNTNWNLGLA